MLEREVLAINIRDIRKNVLKLTQEEIANELKISENGYAKMERLNKFKVEQILKIFDLCKERGLETLDIDFLSSGKNYKIVLSGGTLENNLIK